MTLPPLRFEYAASPASVADPSLSASWTWHEATDVVSLANGPTWNRGRQDERSAVGPGACTLLVDDTTGAWAPDGSGAVRIGTPIRVRYLLPGNNYVANSTFEAGTSGWSAGGGGGTQPTITQDTAVCWTGGASLKAVWGTATSLPLVQTTLCGLVIGRTYTASAYVRVPTGSSDVILWMPGRGNSSASSRYDEWQRLSFAFTASAETHDLQVWTSTGGVGTGSFNLDGVMVEEGTSASAFTATAPSCPVLWDGFVSGLQSSWRNGIEPLTTVRAVDLMGWLARQETSAPQAASAGIEALAPVAWWPCDDPSGSSQLRQAGSASGVGPLAMSQIGESGGTALTNVDGVPALALDPAAFDQGLQLGVTGGSATIGADRTYAVHFRVSERPAADAKGHIASWCDGSSKWLGCWVDSGGRLQVETTLSSNLVTYGPWPAVADSRWHALAIVLDQIGTGSTCGMTVYLDGVAASTDRGWSTTTAVADTLSGLSAAAVSSAAIGMFAGEVAHVAAFDAALTQDQVRAVAGPGCSAGLDAGEAVTALLAPTNVVPATSGTFAATLGTLDLGGSMLSAVQAAAAAERGVVHARPGAGIEVQARSVRRSPTAAITLAAADVASDLAPQSDEQSVVNDVTVTGQGQGIAARRLDTTSIAAYGRRAQSYSLPLTDVASCDDHAAWVVTAQASPSVRVGSALVQVTVKAATVDTAAMLGLDLSDMVTITGLPGTPASLDLLVEGIAGRCTLAGLDLTLNLSPQQEPDLIDYGAQGDLLAWWDARYPSGIGTQVPDKALIRTWEDLSGNGNDATALGAVNLLSADEATFETAWDAFTSTWRWLALDYPAWATYSRSSTRVHAGTYAGKALWASGSKAGLTAVGLQNPPSGLIEGAEYTVSAYVWKASGPAVALGWYGADLGTPTSGSGSWERISYQTTARASYRGTLGGIVPVKLLPAADGAGEAYIDDVMVEEGHVTPSAFNTDPPGDLRPAVRYGPPGSSPMLETSLVGHVLPLSSALTDTAPCTLYLVLRPDALDRYVLSSSASSVFLGLVTSGAKAKWRLRYLADGDAALSDEITSPVGQVCVLTVQIGAGGAVTFRHNGTAVGGQTDAGILGLSVDRIGGTGAGDTWDGGVGCVLAYGDTHSAATVARIERALALMWGVTLA